MNRYVILEHRAPRGLHWDLMLESAGVLRTWALAAPPDSPGVLRAEPLVDHRLAYLDYEGEISGGRGSVVRWDRGTYVTQAESAAEMVVALDGDRLHGRAVLRALQSDPVAWEFQWTPAPQPR